MRNPTGLSVEELADLYTIALTCTDDKQQAGNLVKAYLAGMNDFLPSMSLACAICETFLPED